MNDFKLNKILELKSKKYCFARTQIDKIEKDELDKKADYAATEDFNFFAGFKREPKFRQGVICKIKNEDSFDEDLKIIPSENFEIISDKNIDFIDVCELSDFFLAIYREYGKKKLKLGAYIPNQNIIREIEYINEFELKDIASNKENKALVLIENNKEQVLLSYDFIDSYKTYNSQTICKKDTNKERIFDIRINANQVNYKLRENYRTKLIGNVLEKKDKSKVFVNQEKGYSVYYKDLSTPCCISNTTLKNSHLHIHLNCLTNDDFESFDFLCENGSNILKIERNFRNVYLKNELEIESKRVIDSIKSYFEEEQEKYDSISISGIGFAGSVAINIIENLKEIEDLKNTQISGLVLENFVGDNLSHKYTSYNGYEIANLDYKTYWQTSPLNNAENLSIPCLIISHKENYDFWYGSALSFYGAMKFLNKKAKYILIENSKSQTAIQKRKDEIIKWIR